MSRHKSWNHSNARHLDPYKLVFSVFTANDIRNLSVTQIKLPISFNNLGHPLVGGLYDPALGPSHRLSVCSTCGSSSQHCVGHFGHIELPMPVVNPLFHKTVGMLIKLACLNCFKLQIPLEVKLLLPAKLKLLQEGFFSEIDDLEQEVTMAANFIKQSKDSVNDHDYIQNIIDTFVQSLQSRNHLKKNSLHGNGVNINIKGPNMQWYSYIESLMREYYKNGICKYCQESRSEITIMNNKVMIKKGPQDMIETENTSRVINKAQAVMIMPDQLKEYMRNLWENEHTVMKVMIPCLEMINDPNPTDVFFFDVIPVLPPIVRPVNFVNDQIVEHPQTQVYKAIVQDCLILKNIIQAIQDGDTSQLPKEGQAVLEQIRGDSSTEKLHNAWLALQANADHLLDRDLSRTAESLKCQGLKQIIEKKEGVIRMHMMGKRVNFAARSVITPDPNLNIDEVGVPEAFALKLTYPIQVTPYNVSELRQRILNGPDVLPGAVMLEDEDGRIVRIKNNDYTQREAIAKSLLTTSKSNKLPSRFKTVYRHLQNGDMLLLNRQPTLHKPSIMAHKARILKGEKTFRLHYANCKAYNADFDGDEMNAHFPQNEVARSEAYTIANVSNQYLVPKDGTPLSGLIQDHVIGGVKLTVRGKFFSKQDYMQLVYSALSLVPGKLVLLPPAIVKPKPLWSGKQILSTVIQNIIPRGHALINLDSSAKIRAKEWQMHKPRRWKCGTEFSDPNTMSEAEVIIRNGELLCGVLDKGHYGATSYGLVHCIYELYGGKCSSKMLSAFGKLFQTFLQLDGFTLGIEDILILAKNDAKRKEVISKCRKIGEDIQRSVVDMNENAPRELVVAKMEELYWSNPKFRTQMDRKYKSALDVYTNDINKTCLPDGLLKKFPHNNLQLMVQSGAKGSTVNTMQISCLLGQIELEGKRPPLMISGKSLPSFLPYDPMPRAGGFIDGRFLTGIQPQEFFFHCMAGREGLIDTAVKTSRSGYLQRCLIKHLEGLKVCYDSTVRDSDGSLVQMAYGEDGLDVCASRFLHKEHLSFLIRNKNVIINEELLKFEKDNSNISKINELTRKINKWEKRHGDTLQKRRVSAFTKFSAEMQIKTNPKYKMILPESGRSRGAVNLMKKWIRADEEVRNKYEEESARCPDPVASNFVQKGDYGILPERLQKLLHSYTKSHSFTTSIGKNELKDLLCTKVVRSFCALGEPVGLLAAQSIGEPSTQMTLNTFHFAGRGEMNVTLGIPRLREILMMASKNIKTPSMEIPFKSDVQNIAKKAEAVQQKLTKCVLSDVLKCINVEMKLVHEPTRCLLYTVHLEFLPRKSYKKKFCIRPRQVLDGTETIFFKQMFKALSKSMKSKDSMIYFEDEKKKRKSDEDANLDEDDPISDQPSNNKNGALALELGELHESSDEEEMAEDADATVARTVSRHRESQEYEDPEDEEIDDVTSDRENDNNDVSEQTQTKENDEDNNYCAKEGVNSVKKETQKLNIISKYRAVDYDYDDEKYLWCKMTFALPPRFIKSHLPTILRSVANKIVLWETPQIKKAFLFENTEGETIIKTDGINIIDMFKYDKILDLRRLYTNDIYAISQTYGIEAANKVIVKEVKEVFRMYGITVDSRHLSLIADYMTFDGTFQPLNRRGMEISTSPLQQMSFESSLTFLKNATLQGKQDDLLSPSSRLMVGQPCKSGTGTFTLLTKI